MLLKSKSFVWILLKISKYPSDASISIIWYVFVFNEKRKKKNTKLNWEKKNTNKMSINQRLALFFFSVPHSSTR